MLGILGLGAIFVKLNEIMIICISPNAKLAIPGKDCNSKIVCLRIGLTADIILV